MIRRVVGVAAVAVLWTGIAVAPAHALASPGKDEMYQCLNNTHVWDRRQCPEFKTQGPAGFPGGGGGGGPGGLLGIVDRITGGLLG